MANIEIERKFLVRDLSFKERAVGSRHLIQGYISREKGHTVRVRLDDSKAWLTIKGAGSANGMSRSEWEWEIPAQDALGLLRICQGGVIDKTRHLVPVFGGGCEASEGRFWEVDEFHGANEGLVVAEIELASENENFPVPDWIGEEVTGDRKYYNSMLSVHPFSKW
ncbi:MAG: CYTH domain-containing protein [Candidatus Cryptobacteroides sp.]